MTMTIRDRVQAGHIQLDAPDLELYGSWTATMSTPGYGYRQLMVYDPTVAYAKTQQLGRVLLNPPTDKVVDHISRDSMDFRRSNLRVITQAENCQNQKVRNTNKSGHRGIYFESATNQYRVVLTVAGVIKRLGRFNTLEAAIEAKAGALK